MAKFTGCLKRAEEGTHQLWYDYIMKDWFWYDGLLASISYESQEKAEESFIMDEIEWEKV